MLLLPSQQTLALLFLCSFALAGKFKFSIGDVYVEETRELGDDDDLLLIISSLADTSNKTNNWLMGSVEDKSTAKQDNTTQEIDVPVSASNLSIAFGISNVPDEAENKRAEFTETFARGVVKVAATVPGPQAGAAKILDLALSLFGDSLFDMFNCSGPVVVGNAVYTAESLNQMNQGQKACDTRNYAYDTPVICSDSNYTVTYCLERLDAKSAASSMRPDAMLSMTSLAMVLLGGAYALFA